MGDINLFSINTIAIDIASEYYLKNFPENSENGDLKNASNKVGNKENIGNISVARITALIPYVLKIYLDYKDHFKERIAKQIDNQLTSADFKLLQIVSLMSLSGRYTQKNIKLAIEQIEAYEEQSVIECEKKLESLGVKKPKSHDLAMLIKSNDSSLIDSDHAFYYAILQDSMKMILSDNPAEIENNLLYLTLLSKNENHDDVKSKFSSLVRGIEMAKVKQKDVIQESETSFNVVVLSFKRMFGSLFPNLNETLNTLKAGGEQQETNFVVTNNNIAHEIHTILSLQDSVDTYKQYLKTRQEKIKNFSIQIEAHKQKTYNSQSGNESVDLKTQAILELYDGITMNINENGFTMDLKTEENNTVPLLKGIILQEGGDNRLMLSCNGDNLKEFNLFNRALCLFVEERKNILINVNSIQASSCPIYGTTNIDVLLKLYQLALVQNMLPILEKDNIDLVVRYDKENKSNYSNILAGFIRIKICSGLFASNDEKDFVSNLFGGGIGVETVGVT